MLSSVLDDGGFKDETNAWLHDNGEEYDAFLLWGASEEQFANSAIRSLSEWVLSVAFPKSTN